MIRDEQIIEASHNYGKTLNEEAVFDYEDMKCAFKEGAMWANKHCDNVWHDASEEPHENSEILIQWNIERNSGYESYYTRSIDNWTRFIERYRVPRWAYISDLFPKGGKK